jgi:hypothetical protein
MICEDLDRYGVWDVRRCCSSCHEDEAAGYVEYMCEREVDGILFVLCCQAATLLADEELRGAVRLVLANYGYEYKEPRQRGN